jgi:hypothetical protein
MMVAVPAETNRLVRMPWPAGAQTEEVRCVLAGSTKLLPHWSQSIEMSEPVKLASTPNVHYGFPRMVQARNGNLLLFYRVGTLHAADHSFIALRVSADKGKSWSEERKLWQNEPGTSAHNPVALVTKGGRVILWTSRYRYADKGGERISCLWSWSDDHGRTWAPFTRFEQGEQWSCYYMTDAITTSVGLLAGDATFPARGAGNCHVRIWHSGDDGRTWQVRSLLTQPEENLGDEIGLVETAPGRILCLLRDRRGQSTHRLWSNDNGRTWSPRESLGDRLGVFQRPFLTRLDDQTLLLTGRDRDRRFVTACISCDNGQTFGERHVLESYQADGAYTTAWAVDSKTAFIAWYTDGETAKGKPEIKASTLRLNTQPQWLWVELPVSVSTRQPLYVYFGNAAAKLAEDRSKSWLKPKQAQYVQTGVVEYLP